MCVFVCNFSSGRRGMVIYLMLSVLTVVDVVPACLPLTWRTLQEMWEILDELELRLDWLWTGPLRGHITSRKLREQLGMYCIFR